MLGQVAALLFAALASGVCRHNNGSSTTSGGVHSSGAWALDSPAAFGRALSLLSAMQNDTAEKCGEDHDFTGA